MNKKKKTRHTNISVGLTAVHDTKKMKISEKLFVLVTCVVHNHITSDTRVTKADIGGSKEDFFISLRM
jgi:hypothetical protein